MARTTIGLLLGAGTVGVAGGCGFMDNGQKPTNWPSYDANTDPQANRTPSPSPSLVETQPPAGDTTTPPFYSPSPTPNIKTDNGRVEWPAYDEATTDTIKPGQRLSLTLDSCGKPTGAVIRQEWKNEQRGAHHYDIMVVTDGRKGPEENDCDPNGTVSGYSQPTTKSRKLEDIPRGTAMLVDGYANTQTVCSRIGNNSLWAMVEFTEDAPKEKGSSYWVNFTNIGNPPQGTFDNYLGTPEMSPSQFDGLHGTIDPSTCN